MENDEDNSNYKEINENSSKIKSHWLHNKNNSFL